MTNVFKVFKREKNCQDASNTKRVFPEIMNHEHIKPKFNGHMHTPFTINLQVYLELA